MNRIIAVATVAIVAGCQSSVPPEIQPALEGGQAIKAGLDTATDGYGWRVRCTEDYAKAERTCRAAKFGTGPSGGGVPFQIFYINKSGPYVMAGHNTFPGRDATIRVDNGPVLSASRAGAVVSSLKGGRTAHVVYHVWPTGEARMSVDVRGFDAAYARLLSMI